MLHGDLRNVLDARSGAAYVQETSRIRATYLQTSTKRFPYFTGMLMFVLRRMFEYRCKDRPCTAVYHAYVLETLVPSSTVYAADQRIGC